MSRHKVDICSLQEVRWRGASARLVEGKDSRFKLFWVGSEHQHQKLTSKIASIHFSGNKIPTPPVLEFYWQKSGWRQFLMLSVFQTESC